MPFRNRWIKNFQESRTKFPLRKKLPLKFLGIICVYMKGNNFDLEDIQNDSTAVKLVERRPIWFESYIKVLHGKFGVPPCAPRTRDVNRKHPSETNQVLTWIP